jgi:hypothetical protein
MGSGMDAEPAHDSPGAGVGPGTAAPGRRAAAADGLTGDPGSYEGLHVKG